MIKKVLILAVLAGLGYVGYLVWNNLSPHEKEVVSRKAGQVVDGAKDLAGKAADKLTGVAKDGIEKMEDADAASEPAGDAQPAESDDASEPDKPAPDVKAAAE
jgi:hypothetical protein